MSGDRDIRVTGVPPNSRSIVAVVDEAAPADQAGIYYVVTAAVLLDAPQSRRCLEDVIPANRRRPFHWATEGVQARQRMLDIICEVGVVAHVVVHHPTGRRRQEEARRHSMRELVPLVASEGATELIIESRSPVEDRRDRQSVIEALRDVDESIAYHWATKSERLLWVADAICGAVKEHVLREDDGALEQLQRSRVVDQLRYRLLPPKNA